MAPTKIAQQVKSWVEKREGFEGWEDAYVIGDEVAVAATELNLRQSQVLAALDEMDVEYDTDTLDDAETAVHEKYLESQRPAEKPEITALKRDLAQMDSVDREEIDQLAEKHGLTWKAVTAVAIRLGKFDVDTHLKVRAVETAELERNVIARREEAKATPPRDTQYGVLQPAANVASGCFSLWMWLIIVFVVIAAFVSIFGGS